MKKTYIAPAATALRMQTTQVLAGSMKYGGTNTTENESAVLSDGLGWNSDDWSGGGEE